MARKPARPSPARRVTLLEDGVTGLLLQLHGQTCKFLPRLKKTAQEDWCRYSGAAFFYIVAHSIAHFLTPAQWKRIQPGYRTLLDGFAQDFGDVQGEMAGLHQAIARLRERYAAFRTAESDAQDIIIQAGLWPLQRCLGWKKMPLRHVLVVATLGNLLWSHGAYWFDPARDPREGLQASEADFQMAVLATLHRIARDERIDAAPAPSA